MEHSTVTSVELTPRTQGWMDRIDAALEMLEKERTKRGHRSKYQLTLQKGITELTEWKRLLYTYTEEKKILYHIYLLCKITDFNIKNLLESFQRKKDREAFYAKLHPLMEDFIDALN